MPIPFSQTLRSLDRREPWSFWAAWLGAGLLLTLWLLWFFLADVALRASSQAAWLEAESRPHRVTCAVGGQVVSVHTELGAQVAAGDLLVLLDDRDARALLLRERARRQASIQTLAALETQIQGEERRTLRVRQSKGSATDEARARRRQATAALADAQAEVERLRPLVELGILGKAELERAEGKVRQLIPAVDAQAETVALRRGEQGVDLAEAEVRLDQLNAERVREQGLLGAIEAEVDRLEHLLEQYRLVAPVSGEVGRWDNPRPGDVMAFGESPATVIPAGELRVVAEFLPSVAVGRIRQGQPATVAYDGFPWTQFGKMGATVKRVARQPGSGRIRVELEPRLDRESRLPLEHGLPGTVEVEVERLSPAALVLRLAGRAVGPEPRP